MTAGIVRGGCQHGEVGRWRGRRVGSTCRRSVGLERAMVVRRRPSGLRSCCWVWRTTAAASGFILPPLLPATATVPGLRGLRSQRQRQQSRPAACWHSSTPPQQHPCHPLLLALLLPSSFATSSPSSCPPTQVGSSPTTHRHQPLLSHIIRLLPHHLSSRSSSRVRRRWLLLWHARCRRGCSSNRRVLVPSAARMIWMH